MPELSLLLVPLPCATMPLAGACAAPNPPLLMAVHVLQVSWAVLRKDCEGAGEEAEAKRELWAWLYKRLVQKKVGPCASWVWPGGGGKGRHM